VEINGLLDRKREKKVGIIILGIFFFFLSSFFIAPLTVEKNTIPPLSGRANAFDYVTNQSWGNQNHADDAKIGHNQSEYGLFSWSDINFYAAFTYAFGDFNCHQKFQRSWEINGNQMPVCVRDIGIFFGLVIGSLLFYLKGFNRWTIKDTMLSIFPDKYLTKIYQQNKRWQSVLLLSFFSIVPLVFDGFLQLLTPYESTSIMRLVTGLPFGFIIGLYLCSSFSARPNAFTGDASLVRLPGGARFAQLSTQDE
tara:strand:+ start:167 stop:922 length:756 start_codon:yes stop_codon:yes gene_type:complete